LDDHTLLIAIGDVSDKGVPAALFMVKVKTLIRAIAKQVRSPQKILEALNPELCRDNDTAMFVTLFLATLTVAQGGLSYSFGGHNRPLLLARDGRVSRLQGPTGIALGVMEEFGFAERHIALEAGDGLLLYTDGISEAMDANAALFGEERLVGLLLDRAGDDAQELVERVSGAVREFSLGAEQADDITVLALRLGATRPA
jgi:sigma-B regulation protein RsbU (phosphoserine phosphatase)